MKHQNIIIKRHFCHISVKIFTLVIIYHTTSLEKEIKKVSKKFCSIGKSLYFCNHKTNGSVAQLNRASDYGSEGYRFESCRSHQHRSTLSGVFLFRQHHIKPYIAQHTGQQRCQQHRNFRRRHQHIAIKR